MPRLHSCHISQNSLRSEEGSNGILGRWTDVRLSCKHALNIYFMQNEEALGFGIQKYQPTYRLSSPIPTRCLQPKNENCDLRRIKLRVVMDNCSKTRSHDQREVTIHLPIRSSTIIHRNATVNHLNPRAQYQRFFTHAQNIFAFSLAQ